MKLSRKTIIISAIVILVLGGSVAAYFVYKDDKSKEFNEETNQQGGAQKPESDDGTKLKEDGTPIESTSPGSQSPSSAQKTVANVTLTSVTQNNGTINAGAFIGNGGNGTCKIVFEKSGYPNVEQTTQTMLVSNYYACQNFTIPASSFAAKGEWSARVYFSNESHEGTSNTLVFNIQ